MKWPSPLKNSLDSLHPVCALKNMCYAAADRERAAVGAAVDAGVEGTDVVNWDACRRFVVYGKLWWVLLIVWDELNSQHDGDFIQDAITALDGDIDTIMEAMYG